MAGFLRQQLPHTGLHALHAADVQGGVVRCGVLQARGQGRAGQEVQGRWEPVEESKEVHRPRGCLKS